MWVRSFKNDKLQITSSRLAQPREPPCRFNLAPSYRNSYAKSIRFNFTGLRNVTHTNPAQRYDAMLVRARYLPSLNEQLEQYFEHY